MIRFQESKALRRKIRQDDIADLAIPTWTLVRKAMRAGRIDEALEFMEYGIAEDKAMHETAVAFVQRALTALARFGEEEIEKLLRERYSSTAKDLLATTTSVEEQLQRYAEYHRGHGSDFSIIEEPDRYVMRLDTCGTGGRLRRTGNPATTKKAYPWSWGKIGVPYYCLHCCIGGEIIPIEMRGYPAAIVEIGERPEEPSCVKFFYKKPELIPEKYFTRIGKAKTIK